MGFQQPPMRRPHPDSQESVQSRAGASPWPDARLQIASLAARPPPDPPPDIPARLVTRGGRACGCRLAGEEEAALLFSVPDTFLQGFCSSGALGESLEFRKPSMYDLGLAAHGRKCQCHCLHSVESCLLLT